MALEFGTLASNDAWLIASVLPNLLFGAIGGAISSTTVPLMAEARENHSAESQELFVRQAFWAVSVIAFVITVIAEIVTPTLSHLLAPGFHGSLLKLTIVLARIVTPTLVVQAVAGFFSGILQERDQYRAPASIPVLQNIIRIIGIVVLSRWWNIEGVAIGFTVAMFAQIFVLVPPLRRAHIQLAWPGRFDHPLLRKMGRMSLPYIVNSSVNSIEIIVDRVLSSWLITGSIAAINYSFTLVQVPLTLFLTPLVTPLLTRLSQYHARSDRVGFTRLVHQGLGIVLLVLVPVTVWFTVLRVPILVVLFQHGAFTSRSTRLTSGTLLAFGLGIPGFGLTLYFRNLFFAMKDTKVPAFLGIIGILCNVAGDLTLVHPLAAQGLSLSTSIANWINAGLLAYRLHKYGYLSGISWSRIIAPIMVGGGMMVVVLVALSHLFGPLPRSEWLVALRLGGEVMISGLIFLGVLRLGKNSTLDQLTSLLRTRMRRA